MNRFKALFEEHLVGIFVFALIGFTIVYGSILILGGDNVVEEAVEAYLREEYHIEIDFSEDETAKQNI